ncbi:MAG TPA: isochorismatase family cysteine hydrolase [Spirochaetota bacterium]|nr:isochorismatase family cysteine hydrolase [Spirochaetota bacterium]HPI88168.1 isochorismatase family cysteine hydrolase [Spirochaetota bacterium]HPR47943.1 isochorismatase family cysteine hydrolase [Spirochaetota bacterium]
MNKIKKVINNTALIIVDMQNYYLLEESSYYQYFNSLQPGCLDYIINRCYNTVLPNIKHMIQFFNNFNLPVIYLRLCGIKEDRRDLHHFFKDTHDKGFLLGFPDIYPLKSSKMAQIHDDIKPRSHDTIIDKTTYSPFTSTDINTILQQMNVSKIIFSGLATSQCVETSARDASDRGYTVIHIEDAQADYDELTHTSSLFSSKGVCGGIIMSTDEFFVSVEKGAIITA